MNTSPKRALEVLPIGVSTRHRSGPVRSPRTGWGKSDPGESPASDPLTLSERVTGGRGAVEPSAVPAGVGGPDLGLTVWDDGDRSVVVSVTGEVDIATAPVPSEALGAALQAGIMRLVCDLRGVTFLDAFGSRALLVAHRRAVACGAWLDVACMQLLPLTVMRVTGLDEVFALHDSVAEAVDAQEQRPGPPNFPPLRPPADMVASQEHEIATKSSLGRGTVPSPHPVIGAGT